MLGLSDAEYTEENAQNVNCEGDFNWILIEICSTHDPARQL